MFCLTLHSLTLFYLSASLSEVRVVVENVADRDAILEIGEPALGKREGKEGENGPNLLSAPTL